MTSSSPDDLPKVEVFVEKQRHVRLSGNFRSFRKETTTFFLSRCSTADIFISTSNGSYMIQQNNEKQKMLCICHFLAKRNTHLRQPNTYKSKSQILFQYFRVNFETSFPIYLETNARWKRTTCTFMSHYV